MRSPFTFSTPLVLIGALAACSPDAGVEELASQVTGDEAFDRAAESGADGAYTYFAIAADLRRCAAPLCGGWFLERLNRETTRCHDGRYAESCYAPVLDWSQANLSETQQARMAAACNEGALSDGVYAIVRGRFAPTNSTTPLPELGRFVITEAWVAENDALSEGVFVRSEDNGLRCLVAPCPSYTETVLNTTRSTDIAEVDFTPTGLDASEIDECIQTMSEPGGMLVSGYRYTVTVDGRTAKGRTATAAYERLADAE